MESFIKLLPDKYTVEARIVPGLAALLPVLLAGVAWLPKPEDILKLLLELGVLTVLLIFFSHIARYRGQKVQEKLIAEWGGLPSTIMLAHEDESLDPVTKQRYHSELSVLMPSVVIPTAEDERDDPSRARQIYDSCCSYLRNKTRDQKQFQLLLAENIHYGRTRNLFGIKSIAISLDMGAIVACIGAIAYYHRESASIVMPTVCLLLCAVLLVLWLFAVTKSTVRQAANGYGLRLLETIDVLVDREKPATARRRKADEKKAGD